MYGGFCLIATLKSWGFYTLVRHTVIKMIAEPQQSQSHQLVKQICIISVATWQAQLTFCSTHKMLNVLGSKKAYTQQ